MELARTFAVLVAAFAVQLAVVPAARAQDAQKPADQAAPAAPAPAPAQPAPAAEPPAAAAPAAAAPAATPAPEAGVAEPAPAATGRKQQTEEITVTGSRVRRKDLTTPAPVTVISKDTIQASGKVSIGEFLQSLPEQGNSINTGVNNGGDGSVHVSLRSVGPQRTLVLINGRRMVNSAQTNITVDNSPDLSAIPTAAIERVEVLKDGASAVYGSDAEAGVINLITRRNWSGSEFNGYYGTSSRGDGQIADINATVGKVSDSGSILFSIGYFSQKPVWAGDRSFSDNQVYYDSTGQNFGVTGPVPQGSSRVPGGRVSASGLGDPAFTSLVNAPDNVNAWAEIGGSKYLVHDASLQPTATNGIAGCMAAGKSLSDCQWRAMDTRSSTSFGGDLYNFALANYLVTPVERISLWTNGDTRLGDYARGYFEAQFVNRQSKVQLAPEPLIIGPGGVTDPGGNLVSISKDNVYNPFGKDFTSASRRLEEFGPRKEQFDVDTFRTVVGLDGTLPEATGPAKGWFWDVSFNYGRSLGTSRFDGNLQQSRIQSAIGPSFRLPNGQAVCGNPGPDGVPGTADDVITPGCVPLDLFHGAGTITPDQVAYLGFRGIRKASSQITEFQASVNGELFKLPSSDRPVGLAAGYEHRYLYGYYYNDPLTAKFDNTNGGAYNTEGGYSANEGWAELSIPLANGMQLLENLEVSAAARIFNYSNFGSDWTYKLGARYTPIRDVTLRGTYSTAFRAPSITELYAGNYDNFPSVTDPCAKPASAEIAARCGVAAGNGDDSTQLRSTNGGNPDLKPETAKIYTVGIVYQPSFLKNLSVTLDYYNLDISKAITTIGESTILAGCYTTGLQPQYCQFVERDPLSHQVNHIVNLNQNVGKETSAGVDLALRYMVPTPTMGRFSFLFDGTWLQHHDQVLADGTVVHGKGTFDLQAQPQQGGTNPEWKFLAGVLWAMQGYGAGLSWRYIGAFKECGDSTGLYAGGGLCYVDDTFQRRVKAYNSFDLTLNYGFASVAGKTNVGVGVNNLTDAKPAVIYNGFASATDQYTYDQVGRFYYARLTHTY